MADKDNLILTAVGPDKIGLIEKISEFVLKHGSSIDDSKMAVFSGEFALILLISGEGQNLLKIANGYSELAAHTGLNIWIKAPSKKKPMETVLPYELTAFCMDHPGVVYKLSNILSNLGINIESMETKTYAAPVSATPLFRLEALISVPTKVNINDLRARFVELEKEENIDIKLSLIAKYW